MPASFSDSQAVLIEPLATPVHAVRLAGDLTGKAVVILGAGTIGLLTLLAARHAGAKTIVSTDVLAGKRELALSLGADSAVDAAAEHLSGTVRGELGESADVVFDCVSTGVTLSSALEMAVKGGSVVVVGGPRGPVSVDLPALQEYQIRLQGSATYTAEDFDRSIELISRGAVDARRLITSRFPMSRAADAFAAIAAGGEVKIVVEPDDGSAS